MSESKQTIVDWLIDQLEQKGNASVNMSIGRMVISIKENEYIDLIQQAKEMDKQRIMDARQSGINAAINGKSISNIDYYNETYGGDTK
jgi:hypothetical protein